MSSRLDRSQTGRIQRLKQKSAAAFFNANPATPVRNLDPSTLLLLQGGRQDILTYDLSGSHVYDAGCCPPKKPYIVNPFSISPGKPFGTNGGALGVAYGKDGQGRPMWVVVGRNSVRQGKNILYSYNPSEGWSECAGTYFINDRGTNVAYYSGLWVAVGNNNPQCPAPSNGTGNILWSRNPATGWTLSPGSYFNHCQPGQMSGESRGGSDVLCVNGLWVAVGTDGSGNGVLTSRNPTVGWTITTPQQATSGNIVSLAYGNGYWVIVSDPYVAYTTNPTATWKISNITIPNFSYGYGIGYGNGVWVITDSMSIIYSTDLITWKRAPTTTFNPAGITFANGIWVTLGNNSEYNSTDPTKTWTKVPSGASLSPGLRIAYGLGTWVAVGYSDNGTIIYSSN